MTTTEVLNLLLLAQLSNISLYSSEQQSPLYTFSGQLYKSEEHKSHFMKAEKEVLFRECKYRGSFWEYGEKEITHACDPLTSSHTGQFPRTTWSLHKPYSLMAWRFYPHLFHQRGCLWLNLIPAGHNTKVHNSCTLLHIKIPKTQTKTSHLNSKDFF